MVDARPLELGSHLTQLAQELVRIPSVNPMGGPIDPTICFEHRVTDYLESYVRRQAWDCERLEVEPQRDNLLVRIPGHPESGTILLEVHQDTVPVAGMTVAPFGGELRAGRLYGRGACDVKGGIAAVLGALHLLQTLPSDSHPTVVAAFTVNEEFGFSGARRLRHAWERHELRLLPSAPRWIVVAEPTLCQVVVAHKGVSRWRIHTQGQSAHSSQPQLGRNAIYGMARLLRTLEDYATELQVAESLASPRTTHPLLGRPTLSVGLIDGGISANTVPDRCTIVVDRRLLPGEEPSEVQEQVARRLREHVPPEITWTMDAPFMSSGGLSDSVNRALAAELIAAAGKHGVASEAIGAHYGTDAAELGSTGIPSVVFGPGSIAQAHTNDEWIEVQQISLASHILAQLATQLRKS